MSEWGGGPGREKKILTGGGWRQRQGYKDMEYMKRLGGGWMMDGLDDLGQARKVTLAVVCLAVAASPVGELEGGGRWEKKFSATGGCRCGLEGGGEKWPRT